ncbi:MULTISPECIES: secondary thiamine-phosphate synthase enzyme YjbQ [unclassified Halomonas]|uniref:secondary thiamine-phosphate synthase enzyme YjbQ n=1 Tax=unclassified Halomonas TaxID=2609666 RepID=UPI0005FA6DDA|nr:MULTISPECIES: secondary thiamine-phosphate synthase enzyme YjbQ [unclassified Halomonas]
MWFQSTLRLAARPRGFHLITDEVVQALPDLPSMRIGLLHVFIQHTSASLTINEDADPTVRGDFERHFNVMVPENAPYYRHAQEGSDDMPAHLKASLLGPSLSIPVTEGRLAMGTWQGIYLCEHRDHGGPRQLVLTLNGERTRWRPEQAMPDPYRRRN